jgi:hypothetical protein
MYFYYGVLNSCLHSDPFSVWKDIKILPANHLISAVTRETWNWTWRGFLIAMTMEAVRRSETSLYLNEITRRCIPKGCHLQTYLFMSSRSFSCEVSEKTSRLIMTGYHACCENWRARFNAVWQITK